ncbi:MAG: hypothetical protein CMB80_12905 [Flammeovirgaceae bacterium]|nr:hypothetical protein [Flammeovirgaceae bacterium]HCX23934.1 hypothetical protein [Cytophagales bacterium]|tara:strand:+ start:3491 stop:9184 length:5694 start_codon:yes stop_codon:yes gene_type:complete
MTPVSTLKYGLLLITVLSNYLIFAQVNDVGVSAINLTEYGASSFTASTSVEVDVRNYGSADQTAIPITLELYDRGGSLLSTTTESVPSVTTGLTSAYTFTSTIDLSNVGTYTLKVFTGLVGDELATNDTLSKVTQKVTATEVPYFEDFESVEAITIELDSANISGLSGLSYTTEAPGSTRFRVGTLEVDSYSGSNMLGLDEGNFERNDLILTADLSAYSVSVDSVYLDFFYNDVGDENGAEDNVYVRGDVDDDWVFLFDWNTTTNHSWEHVSYLNISSVLEDAGQQFSSQTQIRWSQEDNFPMPTDGLGLDDIELFRQPDNDLGIVGEYDLPETAPNLGAEKVGVRIYNYGPNTQTSYDVVGTLVGPNGTETITETVSMSIDSGDTLLYTFNSKFDFSAVGEYTFSATTDLSTDDRSKNDDGDEMNVYNLSILTPSFPYSQNFETDTDYSYRSTKAELDGLSGWSFIPGVEGDSRVRSNSGYYTSGTKSLTLDESLYNGSYLSEAIFTLDLATKDTSKDEFFFSFDFRGFTGNVDNTDNRIFVRGSVDDDWIEIYDWFANQSTTDFVNSGDLGLTQALIDNSQAFSKTTQIKFGWRSTGYTPNAGLVIDDFEMYQTPYYELALSNLSITELEDGITEGTIFNASVSLTNNGTLPLSNVPMYVLIEGPEGSSTATESYTGPLVYEGTDSYIFTTDFEVPVGGNYSIKAYVDLPADTVATNDTVSYDVIITDVYTDALPLLEDWSEVEPNLYTSSLVIPNAPGFTYISGSATPGRIRFDVTGFDDDGDAIDRMASMDNPQGSSINYLYLSVDMSGYTTADQINFKFDAYDHGDEGDFQDYVSVRGSTGDPWVNMYYLDNNGNGAWDKDVILDITDALITNTQDFSSTFQIRFGQADNFPMNTDGRSFDDIGLYEMLSIADDAISVEENKIEEEVVATFAPEGGLGAITASLVTPSEYFEIDPNTFEVRAIQFLDYEALIAGVGVDFTLDVEFTDTETGDVVQGQLDITVTDDGLDSFSVNSSTGTVAENASNGTSVGSFTLTGGSGNATVTVKTYDEYFKGSSNKVVVGGFIDYETLEKNPMTVSVDIKDDLTREVVTTYMRVTVTDDGYDDLSFSSSEFTISENSDAGTKIGTLTVDGGSGSYLIRVAEDNEWVYVDGDGLLVKKFFDYEAFSQNPLEVDLVIKDIVSREKITATVQINVSDDGNAVFTVPNLEVDVEEYSAVDTNLGSFTVQGGSGSYEIKVIDTDLVTLSTSDKTFTINKQYDYETLVDEGSNVLSATVQFTDNVTREVVSTELVITITDDGYDKLTLSDAVIYADENTQSGELITQLTPQGGSGNVVATITMEQNSLYTIDSETLEIKAAKTLDYETAGVSELIVSLNVSLVDATANDEVEVDLLIKLKDDGYLPFKLNPGASQFTENIPANEEIYEVQHTGGSGDIEVTMTTTSDYFAFDAESGSITTLKFIDYEEMIASGTSEFTLTFEATDNVTRETSSANYVIEITDDGFDVFSVKETVDFSVVETKSTEIAVGKVLPTGGSGDFEVSVTTTSKFVYDESTGVISIEGPLDYETLVATGDETAVVELQFTDETTLETITSTVTIEVVDDGYAALSLEGSQVDVTENATAETLVGELPVSGGSGDFIIQSTLASDYFGFNKTTLSFYAKKFIDFEELEALEMLNTSFTVTIEDKITGEVVESEFTLTVTDDGFETLSLSDVSLEVMENTALQTVIGTLVPSGGSGTYSASGSSGTSLISFIKSTLEVTVTKELDFETLEILTYSFEVTVKDEVTLEEATGTVTVTITNDTSDDEVIVLTNQPDESDLILFKDAKGYLVLRGFDSEVNALTANVYSFDGRLIESLDFTKTGKNSWTSKASSAEGLYLIRFVNQDIKTFKVFLK